VDPFAALAETHISVVFFAGDRAYKLLKPVRTGFLDFSTPERRAAACARELELNRRFAPDVYLGVSELVERGAVAEHVIVMRRLPNERRLSTLLQGSEVDDVLRDVARAVAIVHAAAPVNDRAAELSTRDAVASLWHHNFDEMAPFAGTLIEDRTLAEVRALADTYLEGRDALFARRVADGFARDGHGDLLADDIFCLADGPRILDCLAFDDDLRVGDVLLDVAMLVMDLERLAGAEPATAFLRWYQEFSNEHHPASLADHYVAYRALVRAKIACLRAQQQMDGAAAEASRLVGMCLAHLRRAHPRLVLVGGAPGTGKSTTARGLAAATGFAQLSSDEIRKDLAGVGHDEHAFAGVDEGIYAPDMTERVYAELIARARTLLGLGESVVVDASWFSGTSRASARDAAAAAHADIVELRCVLAPSVAAARIEGRLAAGSDPSDATPGIARHLAASADPWPEAHALDTTRWPDQVVEDARAVVEAHRVELREP
jgi:hypothetical protein